MNGILVVNKPIGLTSHQVISKIKRILNVKKIGHAGTLDPLASGVLIVLINDATKLSDYLMADDKEYLAEITIGTATTTEDSTGEVIEKVEVEKLDQGQVDQVLSQMIGTNFQTPPMYSAIKQDGKKLYELARKGQEVDRPKRKIIIHNIFRSSDIDIENQLAKFSFQTHVSKGTYIRTLCVDIGNKLNYPAHMSKLTRIKSGIFPIENAYTLEDIENGSFQIVSMLEAMSNYVQVELNEEMHFRVRNGQKISTNDINQIDEMLCLTYQNQLIAIYRKHNKIYKAERVWNS